MMGSQCPTCINLYEHTKKLSCRAFPKGIPIEILTGEFDHSKPHEGDHGITYVKIEKGE